MSARLAVEPGTTADADQVDAAVRAAGLKAGTDGNALSRARDALRRPDGSLPLTIVALGKPPGPGEPGEVVVRLSTTPLPGAEDEHGRMDFLDRSLLRVVKQGDIVAELKAGRPGANGFDVLGRTLAGEPGPMPTPDLGAGLELDADGRIRARCDGVFVELSRGRLDVVQHYRHDGNVNLETGDVEMSGSLEIRGSVDARLSVRATGDVVISGDVESATIDAGGSLTIARFALGEPPAHLSADAHVTVRGLRGAVVIAGDSVTVERECINAEIRARRVIANGPKARVRGGEIRVVESIHVTEVGTPAGTPTLLVAGILPAEDEAGNGRVDKTVRQAHLEACNRSRGAEGERNKGGKAARAGLASDEAVLKVKLERRRALRQAAERARVFIGRKAYTGVVVTIGDHSWAADDLVGPVVLRVNQDEQRIVCEEARP